MPEKVEEVQISHGEAAQRTVTGISTLDMLREGVKKNNRVFLGKIIGVTWGILV